MSMPTHCSLKAGTGRATPRYEIAKYLYAGRGVEMLARPNCDRRGLAAALPHLIRILERAWHQQCSDGSQVWTRSGGIQG